MPSCSIRSKYSPGATQLGMVAEYVSDISHLAWPPLKVGPISLIWKRQRDALSVKSGKLAFAQSEEPSAPDALSTLLR